MIIIRQIRRQIDQYYKRRFSATTVHFGTIERKSVKSQFTYFDQRVTEIES